MKTLQIVIYFEKNIIFLLCDTIYGYKTSNKTQGLVLWPG
jgi:hypothetical protein